MLPHERLEMEWARWNNLEDTVVACSSGTAALHLALETLRLPPGSGVIVPDYTMIACARAVVLAGLTPLFVDVKPDLTIDPVSIMEAVDCNQWVRAVMPVHLYGRRCDMKEIHAVAQQYKLHVIEDLAEAHGVRPHPLSYAACWSFYKNKIVHGDEGGAVWFGGEGTILARSLRCLGFTDAHDFSHIPRGHNYRLSDTHAHLILDCIPRANNDLQFRRRVESWYNTYCPAECRMPPRDVVWVYDLRIRGLIDQTPIVCHLRAEGVPARHGFKPMTSQPEFSNGVQGKADLLSELASKEVLYLPVDFPGVSEAKCKDVMNIIKAGLDRGTL